MELTRFSHQHGARSRLTFSWRLSPLLAKFVQAGLVNFVRLRPCKLRSSFLSFHSEAVHLTFRFFAIEACFMVFVLGTSKWQSFPCQSGTKLL